MAFEPTWVRKKQLTSSQWRPTTQVQFRIFSKWAAIPKRSQMFGELKLIYCGFILFASSAFGLFEAHSPIAIDQNAINQTKDKLTSIQTEILKLETQERNLRDGDSSEAPLLHKISQLRQIEENLEEKVRALQEPDTYACNPGDLVRLDRPSISADKPKIKGPLIGVPVLDQTEEGLCYAAADAILYKSFRPHKNLPSFLDIGISSKETENKIDTSLAGGDQCEALNLATQKGLCVSSWAVGEQAAALEVSIEAIHDYDSMNDENRSAVLALGKKLFEPIENSSVSLSLDPAVQFIQKMAKNINFFDVNSLGVISQNKSPFKRLKTLIGARCDPTREKPDLKVLCTKTKIPYSMDAPTLRKRWLRNKIIATLYSNQPKAIGIAYCGFVLSRLEFETKTNDQCKAEDEIKKGVVLDGDHASVIIGVRKPPNKNGCEYLIQNSFGSDCSRYAHPEQCEDGKVWLSEDALARNIYSVSEISEK